MTTTYGGIKLDGVGGAVTVRNQSGRVEVRGLSGAALAAEHRVETTYDEIVFAWPAGAATPRFSLECSYCSLKTDFEATVRDVGSRWYAEAPGSSAAAVTLAAQSGSISLRKE